MDIKYLYERVCLKAPVARDKFLAALNYTVRELISLYGEKHVKKDGNIAVPASLQTDPGIYDDYENAFYDNIMYFNTGEASHKTDFMAHAQYAYHNVWRRKNKGKRIKGGLK